MAHVKTTARKMFAIGTAGHPMDSGDLKQVATSLVEHQETTRPLQPHRNGQIVVDSTLTASDLKNIFAGHKISRVLIYQHLDDHPKKILDNMAREQLVPIGQGN